MNWLNSNWGWLVFGGGLLLYWMLRPGYRGHHGHHGRQGGAANRDRTLGSNADGHQLGGPANDPRSVTEASRGAAHAGHTGAGHRHRHGC